MKRKDKIHQMNPAMAAAIRKARDNAADGTGSVTPAAVLKAEFPDVIEIAGRVFLPFRLNTLRALQAVKSPIVNAALGQAKAEVTDLDGLIAFWIFTTELPEVRDAIGRGMAHVTRAAESLGDMLEVGDQFRLGKAVALHVQSAFVTILAAAEKDPDLKKVLVAAAKESAAAIAPNAPRPTPNAPRPTYAPASPAASAGPAPTSSGS